MENCGGIAIQATPEARAQQLRCHSQSRHMGCRGFSLPTTNLAAPLGLGQLYPVLPRTVPGQETGKRLSGVFSAGCPSGMERSPVHPLALKAGCSTKEQQLCPKGLCWWGLD